MRRRTECEKTTRREAYCKGKTKKGTRCRAAATEGGLCFFHANPNKAAELGRVGGRRGHHPLGAGAEPPRDLKSLQGVRDAVNRLIEDVYAGKISPRVAASVTPLLALQLRAIRETDLEMRITRLERSQTEREEPAHDSPDTHADAEWKGSGLSEAQPTTSHMASMKWKKCRNT